MKKYIIISTGGLSLPEEITITLKNEVRTKSKLKRSIPIDPTYMDINEAVTFTGLSRQKIYLLASKNQIPNRRNGHRIFFVKKHLKNWMKKNPYITDKRDKKQETKSLKKFEIKLTDI